MEQDAPLEFVVEYSYQTENGAKSKEVITKEIPWARGDRTFKKFIKQNESYLSDKPIYLINLAKYPEYNRMSIIVPALAPVGVQYWKNKLN